MIDTGLSDEVFIIGDMNVEIEVYKLVDAINHNTIPFDIVSCSTDKLLKLVRADRITENTIDEMTLERRDQPLIYIFLAGSGRIIDGNHRLCRRNFDGFKCCDVIVVSTDVLKQFCRPITRLSKKGYKRWHESLFGSED